MSGTVDGFSIAAFVLDGRSEGTGFWSADQLSPKWLGVCREYLALHGPFFSAQWPGALSYVTTGLSSVDGAAIATYSVNGHLMLSAAMLRERSAAASGVLGMFVDSLRRIALIAQATSPETAFADMLTLPQRPLLVVVPWPNPAVSEGDQAVIRELSTHMAGAYFGC